MINDEHQMNDVFNFNNFGCYDVDYIWLSLLCMKDNKLCVSPSQF